MRPRLPRPSDGGVYLAALLAGLLVTAAVLAPLAAR